MSIPHFAESILLPHSWLERGRMILETFFYLAPLVRSKLSHQSEDAIHAAKYLHHLWDQPHQVFGVPRHAVTAFLVEALAFQVELEAENVIGETVVLCRELLTLGMSHLGVLSKIHPSPQINHWINSSGTCERREAQSISALGSLRPRLLSRVFGIDDYEEALSVFDKIVTSSSSGGSQGEFLTKAQSWFVATLAVIRSIAHKTPEYSQDPGIFRGGNISRSNLYVAEGDVILAQDFTLVQIGDPHTDDGTIALRDMNTGPKLFLTKNNYSETLPGSLNPSQLSYAQRP
ncbi:hypothetical protein EDB89DRAFT_1906903 [Lactarius sanguifluus]|nr:hypothetical protein EDB89DRAFT_1906903 [Lactarius sanguifluus]